MNNRPLIAVIPSYSEKRRLQLAPAYLFALGEAGAIGVAVPYTENESTLDDYAALFDGFLFSGGVDVDPVHYGEEKAFDSVEIDGERDRFELALCKKILPTGKPILGICRGIQLLNVACGGTLIQHMEGHRQTEKGNVLPQAVRIDPSSRLSRIAGETAIFTNSFHHQAIKTVAQGLRATAWAEDGTVEAIESDTHPFLFGVQWHPELFYREVPHAQRLFMAFAEACRARM